MKIWACYRVRFPVPAAPLLFENKRKQFTSNKKPSHATKITWLSSEVRKMPTREGHQAPSWSILPFQYPSTKQHIIKKAVDFSPILTVPYVDSSTILFDLQFNSTSARQSIPAVPTGQVLLHVPFPFHPSVLKSTQGARNDVGAVTPKSQHLVCPPHAAQRAKPARGGTQDVPLAPRILAVQFS